jgi:Zn-dependent protease with chaperone function
MNLGTRSQAILFALGFVAGANGLLLGISLYGVLVAALHVLGDHAPGIGWAVLAGAVGAVALIARSFRRADQTRKNLYGASLLDYEVPEHARLLDRLAQLTRSSSLSKAPSLRLIGGDLPNAYTVSRSRDEAAIVLTVGLLDLLTAAERDAVIAHELANIENEDVATVAFADAIAVSIEELVRLKGRFFWGPRQILVDLLPFIGAIAALAILDAMLQEGGGSGVVALIFLLAILGVLRALYRAALLSWRGLAQLFLFISFFGPLTVVEWLLAPPTAFVLSRLIARERVIDADRRAVQLTKEPGAARAALHRLEGVEYSAGEPFWLDLRFSLFVVPRAHTGYPAWRERAFATHPPIAARLRALAQEASRPEPISDSRGDPLEQSG